MARCGTCVWFDNLSCRRWPPQQWGFPGVVPDKDYCGEHSEYVARRVLANQEMTRHLMLTEIRALLRGLKD